MQNYSNQSKRANELSRTEVRSIIQKDAAEEGAFNSMADGAAIGFHNAFKDSAEIFTFIEAVSSSAADATGSFLGNDTEGIDDLLLVTLKLR